MTAARLPNDPYVEHTVMTAPAGMITRIDECEAIMRRLRLAGRSAFTTAESMEIVRDLANRLLVSAQILDQIVSPKADA